MDCMALSKWIRWLYFHGLGGSATMEYSMDFTMNNKIFNLVAVLNEIFREIDIDFDDHIEVMNSIGFLHLFDDLQDYRQPGKIQYKLSDILLLCFLSIIYEGKTTCLGIYDHILVYKSRYEKYGLIKDGQIPSHDTIRRTLMCIDPVEFEEITIGRIHEFLQELRKCAQGTMYCHQSVDGKEARGSGRSEDTKNPQRNINVLNVYSNSDCLCIHSKPVETKTNEIPVAQEILRMMELKKTVITFDALHTQRETCNIIASKKGIYVAPVKDNQSGLREEILEKFKKYEQTPKKKITTLDTEKRNFRFISLPSNYDDCGFTGMKTLVEMVSHTRKKAITMYFISNTKDTELIAEAIERRWEIENNFHKEKDIYLNEDDIHFTNKTSINNIVILNNLALALAKIYGSISTNEMRVAKKEFKAFPVECISKVQLIMKDTEIIKQIKSNLRRKKR